MWRSELNNEKISNERWLKKTNFWKKRKAKEHKVKEKELWKRLAELNCEVKDNKKEKKEAKKKKKKSETIIN